MIRLLYPADPDLRPYFSHHLIVELDLAEGNLLSSFPDAICAMSIFYSEDLPELKLRNKTINNTRALVCGLLNDGIRIMKPGKFKSILTYLTPYGACKLFGVPPAEYLDNIIQLDQLVGKSGRELIERIHLSKTHIERKEMINAFCRKLLNNRMEENTLFREICSIIEQRNGKLRIGELNGMFNISARSIDRLFDRYCGVTPKHYTRLIRLGRACNLLAAGLCDIQDVVYKLGYYDQAHLVHEFASYSDIRPHDLLKGTTKSIVQKVLSYSDNQPDS